MLQSTVKVGMPDVCAAIGIVWKGSDSTGPLAMMDDDERGSVEVDTLGGRQEVAAVSESGLYTIILRSRDAVTPGTVPHRFRKWVTAEVLPTIRRTGSYTVIDRGDPPEEIADRSLNLRTVTETRQSFGNKASQQMWFKLGLPTVPAMFEPQAQPTLFDYSNAT